MKSQSKNFLILVVAATFLLNACGKKDEEKKEETQSAPIATAAAPAAPVAPPPPPPPALPVKFEDASPGTPLVKSTATQKASFELMRKNLGGTKWAKVNFESTYDYIVTNLDKDVPTFAKGPNENLVKGSYQVPSFHLAASGSGSGMSLLLSGNYIDRGNTYYFIPALEIDGFTLYSTESVALFRANSNALEILKVNYTTTTPVIQRFRITELYNNGSDSKWIIFQQNYETSVEFAPKN